MSAGAATGQRLVTMVPSAQLNAASKASASPGETLAAADQGQAEADEAGDAEPEAEETAPVEAFAEDRQCEQRCPDRHGEGQDRGARGGAISWAKASRMLKAAIERKPEQLISRGHYGSSWHGERDATGEARP